jgi:hypothetical protein
MYEADYAGDCEMITLSDIQCWKFVKFKTVGSGKTPVTVRAPSAEHITNVFCGGEDFAQVLAIIELRQRMTVLFVRWYTPSFPESRVQRTTGVSSKYKMLKITDKFAAIPVDHVSDTVHIIPNFAKTPAGDYFYVNTIPLGSNKRATEWEFLVGELERTN